MKVFNFLCQELSVTINQPIVGKARYDLWTSMALHDAHPAFDLTPEAAATYLETCHEGFLDRLRTRVRDKEWRLLVRRIREFNPDHDTPEEIFSRLCGTEND